MPQRVAVESDSVSISFPKGVTAFKFDETKKESPYYHGAGSIMKAVDIVAEYRRHDLFIEICNKPFGKVLCKKCEGRKKCAECQQCKHCNVHDKSLNEEHEQTNVLISDLKYKYRDTFLYRYAEGRVNRPTYYICVIRTENAMALQLNKKLRTSMLIHPKQQPMPQPSQQIKRWKNQYPLINGIDVVDLATWKNNDKLKKKYDCWPT